MELSPSQVAILASIAVLVIMTINVPIAFAFGLVGFVGIFYLAGYEAAARTLVSTTWTFATSYTLMAIPLFILMGEFAGKSGIGSDIYDAAFKWLSKLPGGLAHATIWGAAGLATCTGSTITGITVFGPIAYGPMVDHGYDKRLAIGTICCGPTMGVMIPPSITFVIYATITEESVGKLFMAGVFPGLLQAVLYSSVIALVIKFGIWTGPAGGSTSWREKFSSLKGVWGMLIIIALVLGSIYGGILTPTEAAAAGAFGAGAIWVARKGFDMAVLRVVIVETLRLTCMVYLIMIGSMVFSYLIGLTGVHSLLIDKLGTNVSPAGVMAIFLLTFLILGCFLQANAIMVLTLPVLYPIFTGTFGFSGIWLGVLCVLMSELSFITPPVGMNLFVTQAIFGKVLSLRDIYWGVLPFIVIDFIRLALLIAFPAISLWLPGMMFRVGR